MFLKSRTQQLARTIGVRIPAGGEVNTISEARVLAARIGYPVVVKTSFGCSGVGVAVCRNAQELQAAYARMAPKARSQAVQHLRVLLGRDWYPEGDPLWIQKCIDGEPAMYTFTAFGGRMLAGFASLKRTTSSATGPSTVIECTKHDGMADAARRMVQALGMTGFAAFDFIIERTTGLAYLIECNPRPNQVAHLGAQVGVDLCRELHSAICGERADAASAAVMPQLNETIALFPQEWMRSCGSAAIQRYHHDVPFDEPELATQMMLRAVSEASETSRSGARPAGGAANWPLLQELGRLIEQISGTASKLARAQADCVAAFARVLRHEGPTGQSNVLAGRG